MTNTQQEEVNTMPNDKQLHSNPLWRKIIIIAFLPVFIIIWMVGWTLSILGSQQGTYEIKTKQSYRKPVAKEEPATASEENEEQEKVITPEMLT